MQNGLYKLIIAYLFVIFNGLVKKDLLFDGLVIFSKYCLTFLILCQKK